MSLHPSTPVAYTWPGHASAVAAACDAAAIPPTERSRVGTSRQFRGLVNALSQMPKQVAEAAAGRIDPATVDAVRANIAGLRSQLAAELDAADRVISEVETALGLE